MAEERLSHQDLEKYVHELPLETLARLPDVTETREAKRLIEAASDLAHRSLEKVRPE